MAELVSGDTVRVVNPEGKQRTVTVGRVKIEERPLLLVEAETANGVRHSVILQNAETVRLVGPNEIPGNSSKKGWKTISVAELKEGDEIFVHEQAAARHTGIEIEEKIVEK